MSPPSGKISYMIMKLHVGIVRDASGDEYDGYDETVLPVEFSKSGQIPDDDLYKRFVCKIPAGVTATCLMDWLHSGTVLELY